MAWDVTVAVGAAAISADLACRGFKGLYFPSLKMNENVIYPYFGDRLIQDKPHGLRNANNKGKTVAFSLQEYNSPSFRPEYIEFKPKFQFQKFNKDGFDPFLRNINQTMSVRKRKDQDVNICRDILSAEVIEYEDQDPPYPACSKTAGPAEKTWTLDSSILTIKPLDTKEELAYDPSIITIKALDTTSKLKESLPNVSLSNFKGEPSMTKNVNANVSRLSKSLSLTSHLENLKQSVVLQSILSKNLHDFSDTLFSKPEVGMNNEATKKSSSLLSIHDKPSSSMEDKVWGKIQDLDSWLSEKDIFNSKAILSQIIKTISADSLLEHRPAESLEVEECVSEKHVKADEIDIPIKKESSFKRKHPISKVSSSKSGLSGLVYDHVIKQIFTAPIFSELEIDTKEPRDTHMNSQNQLPTPQKRSSSSHILVHEENGDEIELSQPESVISQIVQEFPIDTLVESGIIKVIELDKEHQKISLLDTELAFPKEKLKDSKKYYSELDSKTEPLSEPNMLLIPKDTTSSVSRVKFIAGQTMFPQDSRHHSTPDKEPELPSNSQRPDREENDLSSTLENLTNSLMGKLSELDALMLKSFFKHIFNAFLKNNQPERSRQPEKELEKQTQHSSSSGTKHLEEIQGNFDKADKLDRQPILSPKVHVFLEELSESEVKNLKSELSKQIQHYLVEKLSEAGHITKEDLPKIYRNLYLLNEEAEMKGQNMFQGKCSKTVKEIMSFVNNFNHHFIDKHLEIKLRSFLNEILQSYFLKYLSESSLFNETESETTHSNISSLRTKSALISFHELEQDISKESFGRRLEIHMKYPLSKSLQNYLATLSENELLNLKADLSKYLQNLFLEKLSRLGQMTERQLEGIDRHINVLNSSSTPIKHIKTDLPLGDENHFVEKHSEKQNKYSQIVQKNTLQKAPEDKLRETELIREKEMEYLSLNNSRENSSIVREQKSYYPKEEAKTLSFIKVQPSSNKNIQAIPLSQSSEILPDILPKNQRKEHGVLQLPQAEHSVCKTEIQDPHSWGFKSKMTQSKACFERTLKTKTLERKEHINIYKLTVEENPETVLSLYPRPPDCKMTWEDEEYLNRLPFPSWKTHTFTHFHSETGEKSKLEDQYCQRLKGNNNNNKKHLVTSARHKKDTQTLYIKPDEISNEKCAKFSESQLFKYKVAEDEKNSKPSLFPELLKRENLKPKVQKERDHVTKPKKSFHKIVRILPTTPSATRIHQKKSIPRTLLHWTARRTIHDCSDKFEDLHATSFTQLNRGKSRSRLLGNSPGGSSGLAKRSKRPNTAPEGKRCEGRGGKFAGGSPGLAHPNATTSDCEMPKMRPKEKLKEGVETCSLICDMIQMLNNLE
ncbi:C2 calcium-dependent domain-containing protein 6 [Carlito syrichta]|uniref:C2 calcium-dependent domain-containing protein 6 n=1 Tax=Carlito syrichta TaxID=1868482 RepID=A0A1U7UFT4_CARSF|nr:C2 calcium-dependent domain-containing protein 6 [Carlito syrichta]